MPVRLTRLPEWDLPRTTRQLVKGALCDGDAASLHLLGKDMQSAEGCVLVLKGRDATLWLRDMLIRQKLLSPGKAINEPNAKGEG